MIKEGDTVQLKDRKNSFFIKLKKGEIFGTHKGNIYHDQIIGKEFGDTVKTHKGNEFLILKPTLYEIIMFGIKRQTQIIYPKDSAYITLKLGITDGMRVLESGIGSGALTIVMANAVKPSGKIYGYEKEEKYIDTVKENLRLAGMEDYVSLFHHDLSEKLPEDYFDAAFIDVREPWLYMENVKSALKRGSPIGFLLPTTNQVSRILESLSYHGFIQPEVKEILLRNYKPVPDRLRPEDRMVAHTGYLIFARKG
ncbi:MAG TPA: tRNA (adenine-N1)-methyltransferase [Persephonella sp.]|uniref:tRNA (adenine(58)-N(1))-methyltransferase TrmI n=1 Tax=Persephonella marina (strain DSM 14350 / EX-H1) TaxID=123214 RepID=C0QQB6_PERMH|nr:MULTISPECIES: tRNA (adenine-N1)-methyltransferase [Persephonella]ACO03963.1 tRNA methyltransferase complex GCD14 subunit [Persephonella marina EX-H1]HCB69532.1 tRNA (adenine-N1)-methyltransferase [Persephonella sp.]